MANYKNCKHNSQYHYLQVGCQSCSDCGGKYDSCICNIFDQCKCHELVK